MLLTDILLYMIGVITLLLIMYILYEHHKQKQEDQINYTFKDLEDYLEEEVAELPSKPAVKKTTTRRSNKSTTKSANKPATKKTTKKTSTKKTTRKSPNQGSKDLD